MAIKRAGDGRLRLAGACLAVALAAPLLVFVAAAGVGIGIWGQGFAFDVLTMRAGAVLAVGGILAAIVAVVAAVSAPPGRRKWAGMAAALAVVAAGVTGFLFWQALSTARATTALADVVTDAADPPGFSSSILAQRRAAGAAAVPATPTAAGCGVAPVPTQVAPGVAGYALKEAGFEVAGLGVGRADGSRSSFWFGFTYDAVVRIRPGRTDVRVTARTARDDGGEACRLAAKVVEILQTSL